jgi:hypothetical protein
MIFPVLRSTDCLLFSALLGALCALCVLCGEILVFQTFMIVRDQVSLMSFLPSHSSVSSSVSKPSASGESQSDSRRSVGVRLAR